jgi:hypothetical protein
MERCLLLFGLGLRYENGVVREGFNEGQAKS